VSRTTFREVSTLAEYPSNLTWDEFLALPHELRNASLIDGEVLVNPPNAPHELVVRNLHFVLVEWTLAGPDRGDFSTQQPVKINDRRGYQPDFSWYPADRSSR
jgi:Uma2 family endonuclease